MAPEACRIKTTKNATYTDVWQARMKVPPTEEAQLSAICNRLSRYQTLRPSCTPAGMFDPQARQAMSRQETTMK